MKLSSVRILQTMILKAILLVTMLALLIKDSHLQLAKLGQCPKGVKAVANFDSKKFSGIWYEMKRYPTIQAMGSCLSLQYVLKAKQAEVTTSQAMAGSKAATKVVYQIDATSQVAYKLNMGICTNNINQFGSLFNLNFIASQMLPTQQCTFSTLTIPATQWCIHADASSTRQHFSLQTFFREREIWLQHLWIKRPLPWLRTNWTQHP